MITTTTHTIEGRHITAYLDIVSAESVQGVNLVRDLFAGMRDIFGGSSQTVERALQEARSQATDEIRERGGCGGGARLSDQHAIRKGRHGGGFCIRNGSQTEVKVPAHSSGIR